MTERHLLSSNATQTRQCRICLQGEQSTPVVAPCRCKGSIEFVHPHCLKEYFTHRFKSAPRALRRRMKDRLQCEICLQPIRGLQIRSARRCANCEELKESMQAEDIFFVVIYMLLYVGFHVVGIIIIIQQSLLARVIGGVWLAATLIAFNFGLYKLARKLFTVREAQVMETVSEEESDHS